MAWKGEQEGREINEEDEKMEQLDLFIESIRAEEPNETETIELEDLRKLGIATLGALKQHPRISAFRRFIEGWHLSYFTPDARDDLLNSYENDSICGTWERLADAVFEGGANRLRKEGWRSVGREKSAWAEHITPHMNVEVNKSPSFCYFRQKIQELI